MGPRTRKLALTAHVVASVGWLGAVGSFLALAVVGLTSDDVQLVRGVFLVAEPLTSYVVLPLAVATLVTGLVQSLGTPWGLLRHYWVLFKLAIALLATFVLLLYTQTVASLSDMAGSGAGLATLRSPTFVLHGGGALVLLLAATALAIYKPRGMTRYGWRKQQELRAATGR